MVDSFTWPTPHTAVSALPVAALVLAADGSVLAVNGGWSALSGAAQDGDGWLSPIHPAVRAVLRGRLRLAAAARQRGSLDCQLAARGGPRWTRWWWSPWPAGSLLICVADIGRGPVPGGPVPGGMAADGQPAGGPAPAGTGDGPETAVQLASTVVRRLLRVGLAVEAAAGQVSGPAADQLRRAAGELDEIVRDIHGEASSLLTGEAGPP
jgi:hypothetical protein